MIRLTIYYLYINYIINTIGEELYLYNIVKRSYITIDHGYLIINLVTGIFMIWRFFDSYQIYTELGFSNLTIFNHFK